MRFVLAVSCLICILQSSFGQVLIEGKVLDQKSKRPIPFANIGIVKSNIGTLSNEDGSFSLQITDKLLSDSVAFSSLGYEGKSMPVRSLMASPNAVVYLTEKAVLLSEVTVTQKRVKALRFRLGNTSMRGGTMQADTTYAGRSIALLIENKDAKPDRAFPLYLEGARLHILRNNLKSIRFRVRINDLDEKTGQPGKDMLEQNLIVESTMRSGWLEFDFSSLNVIVSKPFFVTFEQLTTKSDRVTIANGYKKFIQEHPDRVQTDTVLIDGKKEVHQVFKKGGIDLPGTFIGIGRSDFVKISFKSFVRETSFAEWKKVRGIVTASVELSTQRGSK
jgi:hypothetical protein